ncbi:MAG: hypothetical protein ACTMH5_13335 [Brachybacterium sp.]|uniref:hypothetical protein n=1 Tax=Brachybacterium sp. TaxID=1891286 RepID=UPI003F902BFA
MSRRGRPRKTPPPEPTRALRKDGTATESHGPGHGGPARGTGTRPPFAPGNTVNLRSGHRSPRVYGQLAEHLAAGMLEARPDLAPYPESVAAWATLEAQATLMRRHIAEVGPIDPATGEPRPGTLTWLTKLEKHAADHRARLGLDPRSEAALARERAAASVLAVDLDALAERGRAALASQRTAGIEAPADPVVGMLASVQSAGRAAMEQSARHHAAAGLAPEPSPAETATTEPAPANDTTTTDQEADR